MKKLLTFKQFKQMMKDPIIKAIVNDRINSPYFKLMDRRYKLGGFRIKIR